MCAVDAREMSAPFLVLPASNAGDLSAAERNPDGADGDGCANELHVDGLCDDEPQSSDIGLPSSA